MPETDQDNICQHLETQKLKMFITHPNAEIALKYALDSLPESTRAEVTTAILGYHNTLLNDIQKHLMRVGK